MASSSDNPEPPPRLCRRLGWLAVLLLGSLAYRFPPDGIVRAPLAQFFGRFHPSIVHLPIALILLVPVLEIASRRPRWRGLKDSAGFVLGLAALFALVAAYDGWLLARSGGLQGELVTRHMWGGIGLAAVCLALLSLRTRAPAGYAVLLVGALGLLVWTSDQGGAITHGSNYLTEYLPNRVRGWVGLAPRRARPVLPPPSGSAATFYTVKIAPIFNHTCVSCHGPRKVKGGLRLDSYAGIMHGGEDGPALERWHPEKSEMLRRVTLPADDDDFMPSGGKKALTAAEIAVLKAWITAGASDKEPADVVVK